MCWRNSNMKLYSDTCYQQIGCVLMQIQCGRSKNSVEYLQRSSKILGKNYDVLCLECLTVSLAPFLFRQYVSLPRVTIETDHNALHSIKTLQDTIGKLRWWRLFLSRLGLDVSLCAKNKTGAAEAPSCLINPYVAILCLKTTSWRWW